MADEPKSEEPVDSHVDNIEGYWDMGSEHAWEIHTESDSEPTPFFIHTFNDLECTLSHWEPDNTEEECDTSVPMECPKDCPGKTLKEGKEPTWTACSCCTVKKSGTEKATSKKG